MSQQKRLAALLLLLLICLGLAQLPVAAQSPANRVYLPLVKRPPTSSIFGFETTTTSLVNSRVAAQAGSLGAYWVRLNGVRWSDVEPTRGAGYNWAALAKLDAAILQTKSLGMAPSVIVSGTPPWASVTGTPCGAVKDANMADFATFMVAVVQRYKDQVSSWELWNEPDVDPALGLPGDSPYGCWGDLGDPYYGGERYGRMLQAIAPAMRAADPYVKIVLGGLLLDSPNTATTNPGKPERFLDGVLFSGAANSFDILAYHAYPVYNGNPTYDHDLDTQGRWASLNGWTLGKASFLRNIMARYGVSKPLWLNETGLVCAAGALFQCASPSGSALFNAQADHLLRIMSRAAAAGIQQVSWYTLEGPGWRDAGLLDASQNPRPAYIAYQRMIRLVSGYTSVRPVDYGQEIEAYRFVKSGGFVDVLWSKSANTRTALMPLASYRSAVIWNGATPLTSTSPDGTEKYVNVGFQAVFIERAP